MNKKITFLSLLLAGANLFAAKLILPSNIQQNNPVNQSNVKNENLYKNGKIKNIKTLKQLYESLNEIEKMLQEKKLISKKNQMIKKKKEEAERKKKQEQLNKMKEELSYQEKFFELQQKKKTLKKIEFKNSSEYINELIGLLKKRILFTERELKSIKIQKEFPVKVINSYSVGNMSFGYIPEEVLRNAVSLLQTNKNLQNKISFKIAELKKELELINKKIIENNTNVFTQKLFSYTDIFQDIQKTLNEITNIKTNYLNNQIQAVPPEMIMMSVYKDDGSDKKNLIQIKEGDMITSDIQVKKISNGYAILGIINE